jgi:hypothetical protein
VASDINKNLVKSSYEKMLLIAYLSRKKYAIKSKSKRTEGIFVVTTCIICTFQHIHVQL